MTKDKGNIAIVVDTMFSPHAAVKEGKSPGPAPALGRTSDMWFLQYYQHGQKFYGFPPPGAVTSIPAPRHIFIEDIITPEFKTLFVKLMGLEGVSELDASNILRIARRK